MAHHDQPLDEHARRAARAYAAAADHYDRPSLAFWDRFGAETVSRMRLQPGQSVVDLCCGAGASALPAARVVGPAGQVLGIDVAEPLLQLARARAAREGLANTEFRCRDATSTSLPGGRFDAVVCVFGVFFAADMTAFAAEMWRLVAPGGILAITTWGPGLFEPANGHFWDAVGEIQPTLVRAFNPWDEITTEAALSGLYARAGAPQPAVTAVEGRHYLDHPDQFWDVVLGSGYRATVDALSSAQQDQLRGSVCRRVRAADITALRTDVLFSIARRPNSGAAKTAKRLEE
jgi:ubiquinone/menaquinone biosynthesis C-methylase UbiE